MITREQYEAREVQAQEARERFLGLLTSAPDVAAAFEQWQQAERVAFEARRDRREGEVRDD
jgi:hypothetical protein